jgi:hypothetical protein
MRYRNGVPTLTKKECQQVLSLLGDFPLDQTFRLLRLLGWTLKLVPNKTEKAKR